MRFYLGSRKLRLVSLALLLTKSLLVSGQGSQPEKPPIDTSILGKWPFLHSPAISRTGRFVAFGVSDIKRGVHALTIMDSSGSWRRSFPGSMGCYFSKNERLAMFYRGDSLHLIALGKNSPDSFISIKSFQWPQDGEGEWIAYRENGDDGRVILWNIVNGERHILGHFADYFLDKRGEFLLANDTTGGKCGLYCFRVGDNVMKRIWEGVKGDVVFNFTADDSTKQIVYQVRRQKDRKWVSSIWCYNLYGEKSELKIEDGDPRIDSGLQIEGTPSFSKGGNWIFFSLQEKRDAGPKLSPSGARVDVWGYRDRQLPPEQLLEQSHGPRRFLAVLSSVDNAFYRLERGHEKVVAATVGTHADVVVISRPEVFDSVGLNEDQAYRCFFEIFSLQDGARRKLRKEASALEYFSVSPGGRWLAYYDDKCGNFFSYDLRIAKERNITRQISEHFETESPRNNFPPPAGGIAGWIRNDSAVLIYDRFDLWKIYPDNAEKPFSVTLGFGKIRQIKLRLFLGDNVDYHPDGYSTGDTLVFTAFNVKNKYNGFYSQLLGKRAFPELLTMGPYTYYRLYSQNAVDHSRDAGMCPVKASSTKCWIVKRESANEYPNYFLTRNFNQYTPLTDLKPQKNYNWLTTELVTYKQLDGTAGQGILYKPENFDPQKKYPVILHYYEQLSHLMYEFLAPNFTGENINIPWFVSQGYLVFIPDIYYKQAIVSNKTVGQWAYNSVIAAAKMLNSLPYVDSKRLGIQGHSFGGEETNYLITHSHLFAAASEMAGPSDIISSYLTLVPAEDPNVENQDGLWVRERGQERFGCTLWERPDLYLGESAVLRANHVTTPLLIIHNKNDDAVQWRQGVEFFMALRRLDKRVWMLQYDGDDHQIENSDNQRDYTIRITQFFDYYLKGKLPPRWMTNGVPARLKGADAGYELDYSGKRP